jgi:predicted kinase
VLVPFDLCNTFWHNLPVPEDDRSSASQNTRRVLLITGSMGAGKTTIMAEATDLLAERRVAHAAIDFDALGIVHAPSPDGTSSPLAWTPHNIAYDNLESVVSNYARLGIDSFIVAAAIERREELDAVKDVMNAHAFVVCRLMAPVAIMEHRVRSREGGIFQDRYAKRVAILEGLIDSLRVEDFTVRNVDRSVTDVALDVLARAGWLSASAPFAP